MTAAFIVFSQDPAVRAEVVNVATASARMVHVATDSHELLAAVTATPDSVVIIDRDDEGADDVLRQINALQDRDQITAIMVVRDAIGDQLPGVQAVVFESTLPAVLGHLVTPDDRAQTVPFDQLMTVSLLAGSLDEATDIAATRIAEAFGVHSCVISVRGDSMGVALGERTWNSITWHLASQRCRMAATLETTLVAKIEEPRSTSDSYVAVQLATPGGSHGFLGLVAGGARIFSRADRTALQAVAARLGAELSWRAVHDHTVDERDRLLSGAGLDPLLNIWNRIATNQLAGMYAANASRLKIPLSVVILDVVDLQGINTRHGMSMGDHLLRRVADALRTTVRTDDILGRFSGSKLAMILQGTAADGAARLVGRVQLALDARPLELPSGEILAIPTALGVAMLQDKEDLAQLLDRAVRATQEARDSGPIGAPARMHRGPSLAPANEALGLDVRATLGGSYRLLHEISRGGMGVVFRADDLALERPVAIKMLRPDLAEDREIVEQLRSEAAMLARLQHPNLVQIYTFGQSGGDSYFVMELVEGEGLHQALARHRLEKTSMSLAELSGVIDEIASALDALHERGVVHRDVKPANVIRDPFRTRSVLVDVGIARRYGQLAQSAGTPGYIAPEVINGQEATARSDVYGLAATAYTMLTLTLPWGEGDLVTVLTRQLTSEPKRPSSLRAELAPADDLLLRALSANLEKRPTSAGAFARALSAALSVAPPPAKPEAAPWIRDRVVPASHSVIAKTRGVVFRSVSRAVGVRDAERMRDAIGEEHAELARALTDTAPLAWQPTDLLVTLVHIAPLHVNRDSAQLARDIARATVRASFRRFFPSSAATLIPDRTLSAIRNVWSQYHSWGTISSMPVNATETMVRLTDTPRQTALCEWTSGMLEQLVILSGGRSPKVAHEACEVRGDEACLFRVTWERPD